VWYTSDVGFPTGKEKAFADTFNCHDFDPHDHRFDIVALEIQFPEYSALFVSLHT
jgi:hypothetical protein